MNINNTQIDTEGGLDVATGEGIMKSTAAVLYGDVVTVNKALVDSTTKRWYQVKTPATADQVVGWAMVCLEPNGVAAGAWGRFGAMGVFECNMTGETVAVEDSFVIQDASNALNEVALTAAVADASISNYKIVAQATTVIRTVGARDLAWCMFDGIHGLGSLAVKI